MGGKISVKKFSHLLNGVQSALNFVVVVSCWYSTVSLSPRMAL